MAKSRPEAQEPPRGYFAWSRDPAVGLFAVMPLFVCYHVLRLQLAPSERNLSEWMLLDMLVRLGPPLQAVLHGAVGIGLILAVRSVVHREIPWALVTLVVALEGTVYGLMLGPLAAALADPAARLLGGFADRDRLLHDLVGSLGAGIYEEMVFRFGVMSLCAFAWGRVAAALTLPRALGVPIAVLVSAVLFSLHHHLREPFDRSVFVFRGMAGVLLGLLFCFRGLGVCVYTHAMYDVYFFLTHESE